MPITLGTTGITIPSGSNPQIDLCTSTYAANVCAAGGVTLSTAQLQILPQLITAASREIVRFCGNRLFTQNTYVEIVTPEGGRQDRGEPANVKLSMFPVQEVTRVASNRATVVTITNTDTSTNQDAWVKFVTAGDVEWPDLVYTGLSLTRMHSGTMTTDTVAWTTASPYTTIQSVVSSINALSGGWQATPVNAGANPNIALMPAAWLVGAREPKGALSSPGANLDLFQQTWTSYDIDRASAILRLYGWNGYGWGGGGAWGDPWGNTADGLGGWGGGGFWNSQLFVQYQAGFPTVPEMLQQIAAEVVKGIYARLITDPSLKSENTGNYSWVARDALSTLSAEQKISLTLFKDFSA